jgi:hypothetical protein
MAQPEWIKELVEEYTSQCDDLEELAECIVADECNRIYDIYAVEEFIKEYLTGHSEYCQNCFKHLDSNDIIWESQNHPFGDSYATETISSGVCCSRCGAKY